ncbi:MAG: peptidoglycan DD-metalloendopeptidase family protein [Halothiobacillaceae bacterium]|nr:peptidoglycan DD-metalloendopeptidase family protein [Halothiobacillaceae bacterium]
MRQRPLFKRERRPTRAIRRILLIGLGAFALGTALWQVLPGSPADRPIDSDAGNTEIPLTLEAIDTAERSASKPSKAEMTASAQPVSLESRPNYDIPGEREALEAIESPGTNTAAVEPPTATTAPPEPEPIEERTVTVRSGDTLSTIFEKAGLGYSDVLQVLDLGEEAKQLERLRPGETLVLMTDDGDEFAGLKYDLNANTELNIFRDKGDSLVAEISDLPSEKRLVSAGGTISGSLYQSAIDIGVPPAQVMQLAEIFGWKVDFIRDVRNGDQFRLIYEVREREGERLGTGQIIAAEYVNRGEHYKAVRYTSPDGTTGYYEPDGSNLERGFLRYPVDFSRISSNFNPKRLHPIHNTVRPHNGVDLAAPTGTPVKSAGAGRVTFIGWKHGYGRVIQVRHDSEYETLYAHMSGFNSELKRGSTIKKSETIGYVGMTGAATGPHLHYEFRVNGKPRDPLKVDLPEANPIASKNRQDFLAQTSQALDQLARIQIDVEGEQPVHVARNEHPSSGANVD